MKKEELKPCPFCGSDAEILTNKDGLTAIACTSNINEDCHLYIGHDERVDHNADLGDVLTWWAVKENAIKAWNRRVNDGK